MLNSLRSKGSNTFVWIIVGLLILGLTGFGIGSYSGGQATTPVAEIGDETVSVNDYVRAFNTRGQELSQQVGQQLTTEELGALGVDMQVLDTLIAEAALDHAAARAGISTGDGAVRDNLLSTPAFRGIDGAFSQDAYEFALSRAGLQPSEYETLVRRELTRQALSAAIAGGVRVPDTAARTIVAHNAEKRSLEWVRLDEAQLTDPIPAPSDAELEAYHTANAADYTLPETRTVTTAYVTEDMLVDTVDVPEEELRALYDDRAEEYSVPERRIADRIVFPDSAAAAAAKARIDAGETDFDAVALERGLSPADMDMGEIVPEDLGRAARELVFGATEPGILGPVDTDTGPALFRINAVLEASEVPFEEARESLFEELALEEAGAKIADSVHDMEVLIAGGASLEDLANETILEIETVTLTRDSTEGLAADAAFRDEAFAAGLGEDRDMKDLTDGVFVLRVDRIEEPKLQPLDEVRVEVAAAWRAEEIRKRVLALAESLKARIDEGETLGDIAAEFDLIVTEEAPLGRTDIIEDTPPEFVSALFDSQPGKGAVVPDGDTVLLARITDIIPADPQSPELETPIANVRSQLTRTTAQDVLFYFNRGIQDAAGVSVNRGLIDQIQSQLSTRN